MSVERISAVLCRYAGKPAHWCPGCKELHPFYVDWPNPANGARWTWDGDTARPTFSPSMHIRTPADPEDGIPATCCHYFLRGGRIEFLGDCTHALQGQTMDLPPIPPRWPDYACGGEA